MLTSRSDEPRTDSLEISLFLPSFLGKMTVSQKTELINFQTHILNSIPVQISGRCFAFFGTFCLFPSVILLGYVSFFLSSTWKPRKQTFFIHPLSLVVKVTGEKTNEGVVNLIPKTSSLSLPAHFLSLFTPDTPIWLVIHTDWVLFPPPLHYGMPKLAGFLRCLISHSPTSLTIPQVSSLSSSTLPRNHTTKTRTTAKTCDYHSNHIIYW